MSKAQELYKPSAIADKLKLYAFTRSTVRMKMLLKDAFSTSTCVAFREMQSVLGDIIVSCRTGALQENPHFVRTFFMADEQSSRLRIQKIQKNVTAFIGGSALVYTLVPQRSLSDHETLSAILKHQEINAVLQEEEKDFSAFVNNKKDINLFARTRENNAYTSENVIACAKQLSLCHHILGGESHGTQSTEKILAHTEQARRLYNAFTYNMANTQTRNKGIHFSDAWKHGQDIYARLKAMQVDPSVEKINIHQLYLS